MSGKQEYNREGPKAAKPIVCSPWDPPESYYFDLKSGDVDTYDHRPPISESKIITRGIEEFPNHKLADGWASLRFVIIEPLHTARYYAWRVKLG